MSALLAREATGRGQHVEVSLLQGALSMTTQNWMWTDRGQFPLAKTYPSIHQASIYECADGEWIHAATMSGVPPVRSEASILDLPEVTFMDVLGMTPEEREAYEAKRRAAFSKRKRDELIEEFHANGLGSEAIVAPHERFDHPQLQATDSVVEVVDPDVGPTTQIGITVFLEKTPGKVRGPQPRAGEHNDEVLGR
jgi:crotonobetainyl-CoA:carnitine CoA-transferase CaiB-like acyl-CoA transferase